MIHGLALNWERHCSLLGNLVILKSVLVVILHFFKKTQWPIEVCKELTRMKLCNLLVFEIGIPCPVSATLREQEKVADRCGEIFQKLDHH